MEQSHVEYKYVFRSTALTACYRQKKAGQKRKKRMRVQKYIQNETPFEGL